MRDLGHQEHQEHQEVEEADDIPPPAKLMETRDSISSIDSDMSLSFDKKRGSITEEEEEDANLEDHLGDLSRISTSQAKLMETRHSISSVDSDVCLSFDKKRGSTTTTEDEEGPHLGDHLGHLSDTSSDAGGKDSGCEVAPEVSEPLFTPPTEELAEKIVQQVEFYFSDANITKDAFLLKHVKRNKEGYVSLKLISSFKRVKHLTKDWRVVAHSLSRSSKLEINEAGTKLRRLEPLPRYDETTPSRTVVAVHMPVEKPTIENVAELFKACGEIALVRILRPGNPIPADVRLFINKNPSLGGMTCALVEFVRSEAARKAVQLQKDLGEPLKVYELNNVPHPERKKKTSVKKGANNKISSESDCISQNGSEAEDLRKFEARGKIRRGSAASQQFPSRFIEPAAWLQRRLSASSTEANFLYMPRRLSSSSRDSSESSLFLQRRMSSSSCSSGDYSSRRTSSSSEFSNPRSRSNSSAFQNVENVLRMPKGPDGSRGFRQSPVKCCSNINKSGISPVSIDPNPASRQILRCTKEKSELKTVLTPGSTNSWSAWD